MWTTMVSVSTVVLPSIVTRPRLFFSHHMGKATNR
jgi:hypothetical protein